MAIIGWWHDARAPYRQPGTGGVGPCGSIYVSAPQSRSRYRPLETGGSCNGAGRQRGSSLHGGLAPEEKIR